MSRYFLRPGEEQLIHGIEIAVQWLGTQKEEVFEVFTSNRREERAFFAIENVLDMLFQRYPNRYEALRDALARMLTFDALVGANDRHPENWGVIENVVDDSVPVRFSPVSIPLVACSGTSLTNNWLPRWRSRGEMRSSNDTPRSRRQS